MTTSKRYRTEIDCGFDDTVVLKTGKGIPPTIVTEGEFSDTEGLTYVLIHEDGCRTDPATLLLDMEHLEALIKALQETYFGHVNGRFKPNGTVDS